ncbi:cobaltochelatase subunit CobN, partial [Burkholderia oklahomensis]
LARFPAGDGRGGHAGLIGALARDLALGDDFDPLASDWAAPWTGPRPDALRAVSGEPWRHAGDTRERLELLAGRLIERVCGEGGDADAHGDEASLSAHDARDGGEFAADAHGANGALASEASRRVPDVNGAASAEALRDAPAPAHGRASQSGTAAGAMRRDIRAAGRPPADRASFDGTALDPAARRLTTVDGEVAASVEPQAGPRQSTRAARGESTAGAAPASGATREAETPDAATRPDASTSVDLARAAAHWPHAHAVLERIARDVLPRLDACGDEELRQLRRGLEGRFVPPGPSGSPSRGRPDVLPTGRNFYSVDTRAVPTQAAWTIGLKSAQQLIERHLQEHGDYPRAVGLSVWGTATMRTGGDDIAQALALLGVRPKWAPGSHRVTDFEILPIEIFDRPRIDVTLRVSGFFRDAFANVMHLFDAAVQAVAELDEPEHLNPVRARVRREADALAARG